MRLYLAVDISDDDVELQEVAEQCGYDLKHPAVLDLSAPAVAAYHGEACLMVQLSFAEPLSAAELEAVFVESEVLISHPSVAGVRKLALTSD